MTVDENGTRHLWKLLNRDGSEKEEVFLPRKPFYAGVTVIKVKCASCGQEHILFDSRIHGYDGMTSEKEPNVLAYQPLLSKKVDNRTVLLSKSRTIHPMRSLTLNQALPLMSNSIPILLVGSSFMELMAAAKRKNCLIARQHRCWSWKSNYIMA